MAHNPDNLHPVLHASETETGETREARQRQLHRLDELRHRLGQLSVHSPEAKVTQREAIKVLNQLFEACKFSHCSCKISNWYWRISADLGAPLSWTPLP